MKTEFLSESIEDTGKLAQEMGSKAKQGEVYALYGDLGTGKTLFTKNFALGMEITEEITSPTFTLLEEYDAEIPLYHFDLYRIESPEELDFLSFEEYWEGKGVSVIEWAERAQDRLPENTVKIYITYIDSCRRKISIEHPDY
ncbi:MAG: tRNA (adenosine(37)-N6)-threonylcarbamoyltransferase complex ATPase subunit type 1 TsaE [Spirochaetes bacterium]|nr:tRNA (adenosine(37)-N6)-threonylcarbamoyltransferase complex ATPase subunit type 1 TsaE [Spirochaetota bacterium]